MLDFKSFIAAWSQTGVFSVHGLFLGRMLFGLQVKRDNASLSSFNFIEQLADCSAVGAFLGLGLHGHDEVRDHPSQLISWHSRPITSKCRNWWVLAERIVSGSRVVLENTTNSRFSIDRLVRVLDFACVDHRGESFSSHLRSVLANDTFAFFAAEELVSRSYPTNVSFKVLLAFDLLDAIAHHSHMKSTMRSGGTVLIKASSQSKQMLLVAIKAAALKLHSWGSLCHVKLNLSTFTSEYALLREISSRTRATTHSIVFYIR